ncbi:MAG: SpoIID/LytB domain-containing protein [Paludibacteraceae bacterium]|nr:SpoIID/LytB domain-containing protein [Paludibacteraceae bacterium]
MDNNITVGIVAAENISFSLNGEYTTSASIAQHDEHKAEIKDGRIYIDGNDCGTSATFTPTTADATFTLNDVVIGIGFHWQRKEKQTFEGTLMLTTVGDDKDNGKITAVNILPIERYLVSVISSEMAATSSIELLKAHAVTSRSWLIAQIEAKKRKLSTETFHVIDTDGQHIKWYDKDDHKHYDVCADDHCQRYQGVTRQTTRAVEDAIKATEGLCVIDPDDNSVCDARFSKCCGGVTERFSACWEYRDYKYLTSIRDNDGHGGRDFCDTQDASILRQVLNSYDQETADFYRWTVKYTQEELSQIIREKSGIDFGTVTELTPVETGDSGRIIRLRIAGTKKTLVVGKELEIRKWLSPSHLYSSAFTVSKQQSGGQTIFTLDGKGWGHGVGLCQIGAAVMAAQGYSYTDIVSHYFPHTVIKKMY